MMPGAAPDARTDLGPSTGPLADQY